MVLPIDSESDKIGWFFENLNDTQSELIAFACSLVKIMENINELILQITSDKNVEQLTYKELRERFIRHNDNIHKRIDSEIKGELYALVEFDYTQMPNPNYRTENQRFWVFGSRNKVFEGWASGYSLFAYCLGDKDTGRMERIFNDSNIKNCYIITQEQAKELYK